jgi:hypothetical protein
MTDMPFHRTRLGLNFFERHVPALLREVTRLNDTLEHLVRALERSTDVLRSSQRPSDAPKSEER